MTSPISKAHLSAAMRCVVLLWGLNLAPQSFAATEGTFAVKLLTPEAAATAAQAAMAHCRKAGYQVSVAIVDRFGVLQVLFRDRYAGPHSVEFATQKAWTAASFRMSTAALAVETQAGKPMSGMRANPHVLAIGGGQTIEAAGSLLGAIGVSGAPGGEADDACASAGLRAVADAIEF